MLSLKNFINFGWGSLPPPPNKGPEFNYWALYESLAKQPMPAGPKPVQFLEGKKIRGGEVWFETFSKRAPRSLRMLDRVLFRVGASFRRSFIWFRRRSLCSPRSGRGACWCVFTYCARSLALSWVILFFSFYYFI